MTSVYSAMTEASIAYEKENIRPCRQTTTWMRNHAKKGGQMSSLTVVNAEEYWVVWRFSL